MSLAEWRERAPWATQDLLPLRPDFGLRFPWKAVKAHVSTLAFQRSLDRAKRVVHAALNTGDSWALSYSGGKDSTAVMSVLRELGVDVPAVSVRSCADYPPTRIFCVETAKKLGQRLAVLDAAVSIPEMMRDADAFDPLYATRSGKEDAYEVGFFSLLRQHYTQIQVTGIFLGLRKDESRGRLLNRVTRGPVYTRADGISIGCPVVDCSALDVQAMIWRAGLACSPVYLCCDDTVPWDRLREDSWFATGAPAAIGGHYTWLRRWWPQLWEQAVEMMPVLRDHS